MSRETDDLSDEMARREAEIMREYEEKFQRAMWESRVLVEREVERVRAEKERELEVVQEQAAEREDSVRREAQRKVHSDVRNMTKYALISQKTKAKVDRRLIFNISHELRTPLNVITTGLHITDNNIMAMEKCLNEGELQSLRQVLYDMKQSCMDCMAVLDDIILYEEIKFHRIRLEKRKVFVCKLIKSQISEFTLHCKMIHIKLLYEDMSSNELVDQGPQCIIDEKRIASCIHSLISSAIRHCNAGDNITVRLQWQSRCTDPQLSCKAGFVRIEVEYTGHGLTGVSIPHIFYECFYNTHIQ